MIPRDLPTSKPDVNLLAETELLAMLVTVLKISNIALNKVVDCQTKI